MGEHTDPHFAATAATHDGGFTGKRGSAYTYLFLWKLLLNYCFHLYHSLRKNMRPVSEGKPEAPYGRTAPAPAPCQTATGTTDCFQLISFLSFGYLQFLFSV